MIEAMKDQREDDVDERLKADLTRFEKELEGIRKDAVKLAARSKMKRVWKRADDSIRLAKWDRCLTDALQRFMIYNFLAVRLTMIRWDHDRRDQTTQQPMIIGAKVAPARPEIFCGRQGYVDQAVRLITTQAPARIAVLGGGGMGKTSTALTIFHHDAVADKFRDNRYAVLCESASSSTTFVALILKAFGIVETRQQDPEEVLRSHLKGLPECLVFLDNLEHLVDSYRTSIENILREIAAVRNITLVITMRGTVSPAGIRWSEPKSMAPLDSLSEEDAKAPFRDHSGDEDIEDEAELDQLIREMDGIPLAVTLMAQLVKGMGCRRLLARWTKKRTALLTTEISNGSPTKSTSLEISIEMSIQSLQEQPRRLLAAICHLPDGVLQWEDTLEEMFPDLPDVLEYAYALQRVALAFDSHDGSLHVLSPIRYYMIQHHQDPILFKALKEYHHQFVPSEDRQSLTPDSPAMWHIIQPHLNNVLGILEASLQKDPCREDWTEGCHLGWLLYWFQPALEWVQFLTIQASQVHTKTWEYADSLCLSAHTSLVICKYQEAEPLYAEAQELYRKIGDLWGMAHCIWCQGGIYQSQSKYQEAEALFAEALELYMQIGDTQGMAHCIRSQGKIYWLQSRHQEAEPLFAEALELYRKIGDQQGMAHCIRSQGKIYWLQSRHQEAECKEN